MQNNNYKVIISKNAKATENVISQLAKLFKISSEKAAKILQQDSFVIKKQTDKKTAEKFHKAITAIGVDCHIEEDTPEEETDLPNIEEIKTLDEAKPFLDPTRPNILPLHEEKIDFSLAAGPVEKASSESSEDKLIEDINPENFCPECGTIRASVNSNCLHCGYNPENIKNSKTRSLIIKGIIGLIVLAIAVFFGIPYYQQYSKYQQIEDDLKLAFDIRNTVTDFIQKTNFWPNQNLDAELPKHINNRSIESVVVSENATITVTLKTEALNNSASDKLPQTLIFIPKLLKGRIVWNCLQGTLNEEFRPEICKKHKTE